MAEGDVYQVVDQQVFVGQDVANVFYFQEGVNAGDSDAATMAAVFIEQVLPAILDVQTLETLHTGIVVTNLFNPSDVHTEAISEVGTREDNQNLPTFDAYAFRLVGDNGAVRNGSKRFVNPTENEVYDGVVTESTIMAALDTLADILVAPLNAGLLDAWFPQIVGRILVSPGVYRLPTSPEEAVLSLVVEAVWQALITSQTSRKIGTGS